MNSPEVGSRGPAAKAAGGFSDRAMSLAIELVIIGAAWYFLKLNGYLVAVLAGLAVASVLVPRRYSTLATGMGMCGVGAFFWLYAGSTMVAGLLAVAGLVITIGGLVSLKHHREPSE